MSFKIQRDENASVINGSSLNISGGNGPINIIGSRDGDPINITTFGPTGLIQINGDIDIAGDMAIDNLEISDTTNSISTSTGSLVLAGGVGIAQDVWIGGSLNVLSDMTVAGTITSVDTLEVQDPLIQVGLGNGGDLLDLGVVGEYTDGTVKYSGAYREAASKRFKFKDGITTNPTSGVIAGGTESDLQFKDAFVDNINYNKNGAGNKFLLNGSTAGVMDISANTGFPTINIGNSYALGTQARLNIVGKGAVTTHNWGMSVDGGQCNSILGSSLGSFKWYDSASTALGTLDSSGLLTINDVDCSTVNLNGSTSGSVTLEARSTGDVQTYVLPSSYPSTGQVLACSDTGTMSWTDNTLQSAYTASAANPEILTNPTNGSINIRQGSGADTDTVLSVQNNSGLDNFSVTGEGVISSLGGMNVTKGAVGDTSYISTITNTYNSDGTKNALLLNTSANSSFGENYLLTLQNEYNPTSFDNLSIRWRQNSVSALSTSILGVSSVSTAGTTYPSASMFLKNGGGYLYLDDTELRFHNNASKTLYVGLKQPASLAVSQTYTLPLLDGSSGQVLSTNGSGVMSWIPDGGLTSIALNDITNCSTSLTTNDIISITNLNIGIGQGVTSNQGTYSTIIGATASSLLQGNKGSYDSVFGYASGINLDHQSVTTPSNHNALYGAHSGQTIVSGQQNVCIGSFSDTAAAIDNSINIGYQVAGISSNKCLIGNSAMTSISSLGSVCSLGDTDNQFSSLFLKGTSAGWLALKAKATSNSVTLTLPAGFGGINQSLIDTDGAGTLGWGTFSQALGDLSNVTTSNAGSGDLLTISGSLNNLSFGQDAFVPTIGANNVIMGSAAALGGDNNIARNVFIGSRASRDCSATAVDCVAIGYEALGDPAINSGNDITCIGSNSLKACTTGSNLTCVGSGAGLLNTTGSSNVYIGRGAGSLNTISSNNVAVGTNSVARGGSCVSIGDDADCAGLSSICIGAATECLFSNAMSLGNGVTTDAANVYTIGNSTVIRWQPTSNNVTDLGKITVAFKDIYTINAVTVTSDERLKKDIKTFKDGLDIIKKLDVLTYDISGHKNIGLSAQHTLKVLGKHNKKMNIVNHNAENDTYGIRYTNFIPLLINSCRELSDELSLEKERNDALEKRLQNIEKSLAL